MLFGSLCQPEIRVNFWIVSHLMANGNDHGVCPGHYGNPLFHSALLQRTRRSGRKQGRLCGGDCRGWGYRRTGFPLPSLACCSWRVASRLSLSRRPGQRARALSGVALSRLRLSTARKRRVYGSVACGNGLAGRHQSVRRLSGDVRVFISLSAASVPTFG